MNLSEAKQFINNYNDIQSLTNISLAKDLFKVTLPNSLKDNEQQQRSILADTIYFLIQCRLDVLSNSAKLYSLGEFYFSLGIPKYFLK